MSKEAPSQSGGKFVNSGAAGCAFTPPLPCLADSTPKGLPRQVLGKVFSDEETFREERRIAEWVKQLDPAFEFTVPYFGACRTQKPSVRETRNAQHIRDATACPFLKRPHSAPQLLYAYGGADLHQWAQTGAETMDELIGAMLPIFQALARMHRKGFLHCDLKPENMLWSAKKSKLMVIDFGLLQTNDTLYEQDWILRTPYPFYPPEFQLAHLRKRGGVSKAQMEQAILNNFGRTDAKSKEKIRRMSLWLQSDWLQAMDRVVRDWQTMTTGEARDYFRTHCAPRVDVYGLGMTLIDIYGTIRRTRVRYGEFVDRFFATVVGPMVRLDAKERCTMAEAAQALERFLQAPARATATAMAASSVLATRAKSPLPSKRVHVPALTLAAPLTPPSMPTPHRLSSPLTSASASASVLPPPASLPSVASLPIIAKPTAKPIPSPLARVRNAKCLQGRKWGGLDLAELRALAKSHGIAATSRRDICRAFDALTRI